MAEHPHAIYARRFYQLFNERRFEIATTMLNPRIHWLNVASGQEYHGPEEVKGYWQSWVDVFSDAKVEIERLDADDQGMVVEFFGRGTHSGPLPTPSGPIAPTGKKIDMRFCEVIRMASDKIGSARLYFDMLTMLRQLGV